MAFSDSRDPGRHGHMMRGVLTLLFVGNMAAAQAEPLPYAPSDQKAVFAGWFAGSYTNERAVTSLTAQGIDAGAATRDTVLHIAPVALPAFGHTVFYAEWQDGDDPSVITRQRFYVLRQDHERAALRLELHVFDPRKPERNAQAAGAYGDPSRVSDFTPADMFPLPGCDIFFQVEGRQFRGAMDRGTCEIPDTDPAVYSWTNMILGPESFWYKDGWFVAATDEPQTLMSNGYWVEFEKADQP